jgi:N-acylneuraminate cytidylyltransferase
VTIVALIPARAGSKRCPGKNTRLLAGHPLLAYSIASAKASGIFASVVVSTEDLTTSRIAKDYGADHAHLRARGFADEDADIVWVTDCLRWFGQTTPKPEAFAILRPTTPFRSPTDIRVAWRMLQDEPHVDSIRAVRPVLEHPAKMFQVLRDGLLLPLLPYKESDGTYWHSRPSQTLKRFVVQNAGLEMAWTITVTAQHSISGDRIRAYECSGPSWLDINTEDDFATAERWVAAGVVTLPAVLVAA